ncbi:MAG: metallophosphoesterase [Verrucomicrobia bacterium]|nr:metallophosphoesterase [Verrucomicrobiota bacterium]
MQTTAPIQTSPTSRRAFLTRSTASLLAAGLWPGWAHAQEAAGENGSFRFLAFNDVHFTDPKKCPQWFGKVFAAMRASAPDAEFALLSGDLTSNCKPAEFGGIREVLPLLRMPVHLTLGNHDVGSKGERTEFEKFFPGKRNHVVSHRGWQIVCCDSVENTGYIQTRILKENLAWLESALPKLDPRRPTILSTHFPLGAGLARRPKNADDLLKLFAKFNLQAVFNGHWHGYSQMLFNEAVVSTNRCCSRYRGNHDGSRDKGWYVCEAAQGKISRRFVAAPPDLIAESEWH